MFGTIGLGIATVIGVTSYLRMEAYSRTMSQLSDEQIKQLVREKIEKDNSARTRMVVLGIITLGLISPAIGVAFSGNNDRRVSEIADRIERDDWRRGN